MGAKQLDQIWKEKGREQITTQKHILYSYDMFKILEQKVRSDLFKFVHKKVFSQSSTKFVFFNLPFDSQMKSDRNALYQFCFTHKM